MGPHSSSMGDESRKCLNIAKPRRWHGPYTVNRLLSLRRIYPSPETRFAVAGTWFWAGVYILISSLERGYDVSTI